MRLIPATDTTPKVVKKYLLPDERQVITVKRHPAILISPIATALGGLLVAVALIPVDSKSMSLSLIIWLLALVLSLWAANAVIGWSSNYFVTTSQRMLLITGSPRKRVTSIPFSGVTDFALRRPLGGRVLGYGKFDIEISSDRQISVDFLPYPEQLYLELSTLYFKNRDGTTRPGGDHRD